LIPVPAPPPKDDTPTGVLASLRHHIAVARMSDDPALLAILDDLERALSMLAAADSRG
jgi:hypothetical protein